MCVSVSVCVCVCDDVDGQNVSQTDNDSWESAITAIIEKTDPICPFFELHVLYESLPTVHLNIQNRVCALKSLITFIHVLHTFKQLNEYISSCHP